MPDPSPGLESGPIADGFTVDRWLGGRLALVQPQGGHRVGTDAALLAAAAGTPEGRIADVGAGVGAVGLALAQRSERASAEVAIWSIDAAIWPGCRRRIATKSLKACSVTVFLKDDQDREDAGDIH